MVNVLFLHGCNQDIPKLKGLIHNYIRLGEAQYGLKCFFIQAEYGHPRGGKTWFSTPLDIKMIGSMKYNGDVVDSTLDAIEQYIISNNIEVLFGFSQGGNVVDAYLKHRNHHTVKRAVIDAGYYFIEETYEVQNMPVLNIISGRDTIVPAKYATIHYNPCYTLEHDKGHKIITSRPVIRRILEFMRDGGLFD